MNEDPDAHLRDIKAPMPVHDEVDRCVECGYCEPVCPSKDLTLTPRQRIVTLRAIEQARRDGDDQLAAALERDYGYDAVETCAVDGMCQTACPVQINTGKLVKVKRSDRANSLERGVWGGAAKNWKAVTSIAGTALSTVSHVPPAVIAPPNKLARAVLGKDRVPLYSSELPGGGSKRARAQEPLAPGTSYAAVYMPACVSTMFGPRNVDGRPASPGTQISFEALCEAAGVKLLVPDNIDSLCCGTPWTSKGMVDGARTMRERTVASLKRASNDGELAIVCDASSCTEGLILAVEEHNKTAAQPLRIIDAVEFVAEQVLPALPALPADTKLERIVLHPTCSSTQLGINDHLVAVAQAAARDVVVPENWGCCAFAGDRGMLHPELTASATAAEATEVRELNEACGGNDVHGSCNRTCELGMTRATGENYQHVIEILHGLRSTAGDLH